MRVLAGEFGEGDHVIIDAEGGSVTFRKAVVAEPA
jgi:hypothetical protein